jgi:hypothetical protein
MSGLKSRFRLMRSIQIPENIPESNVPVWKAAVDGRAKYALAGLLLGTICIVFGLILLILGIAGNTSWTVKTLGIESTISDAPPGIILTLVGLFVIGFTKYDIRRSK